MAVAGKKIKMLKILEILREETDENHSITAGKIIEMLEAQGISCERKSIYSDIECLKNAGYDIDKNSKGFKILEREFEIPELCFLSDAVRFAPFITKEKTNDLLAKLGSLASKYERKEIGNMVYIDYHRKTTNKRVYININYIHEAINSDRKIELEYKKKGMNKNQFIERNRHFKVSPYAMIWSNDHYYLVCNNDTKNNLMHLRIDKITSVKLTNEFRKPYSKFTDYKDEFDVADYAEKTFNAFSGEKQQIELICDNEIYDIVFDRLGSSAKYLTSNNEDYFIAKFEGAISEGLVNWIIPYGNRIKIKKPIVLKSMFVNKLNDIQNFQKSNKITY